MRLDAVDHKVAARGEGGHRRHAGDDHLRTGGGGHRRENEPGSKNGRGVVWETREVTRRTKMGSVRPEEVGRRRRQRRTAAAARMSRMKKSHMRSYGSIPRARRKRV